MISKLLIVLDELLFYKFKQEFIKDIRDYIDNDLHNYKTKDTFQPCKIMKKIADKHMEK